jgi:hypothetical protein
MSEKWNESVGALRSDLVTAFSPRDRITTPDTLRRLFTDAGVPDAEMTPESGSQPLEGPDDVWTVAAGSGYRWVIEQLGPEAERVQQQMVAWAREMRVSAIETNVIYGVATRR